MVKFKGDKEWEIEPQLTKMGDISAPEWHKIWPNIEIPDVTSPPKGRKYHTKNVHNLSTDSESSQHTPKKHKKDHKNVKEIASIFTNMNTKSGAHK